MGYESPIHLINDRMRIEAEGKIIKAIQKVGVYVDKDELLKALAYDRDQYLKGYEDRDKELVRCKECEHFEYNHVEVVDGVPIIVAHEICRFWSGGSKTSEYGYCSFGERRELDDENTAEDKDL